MKKLAILILVLILLTGGYYFIQSLPRFEEFVAPEEFQLSQLTSENLDEVALSNMDGALITLTKANDEWTVNGHRINKDRLGQLFEAIASAEVTSRVSTNDQNHGRFEVDEANGVILTMQKDSQVMQKLVIGKTAGGSAIYARLADSNDVYVIDGLPRHLFSEEVDLWRDRMIVQSESDQIRRVIFEQPSGITWRLQKNGEVWELQSNQLTPVAIDTNKVDQWLSRLTNLQAHEFPTEPDTGVLISTLIIEEGTDVEFRSSETLTVQTQADQANVLVSEGDSLKYLVTTASYEELFKPYWELLEELSPDPEEAE